MAIEDTFGYRFVRISLVLLNCIVLVRLVSIVLQYAPIFELSFVLFFLLIGSNFMAAIIGAIREHRITVLITGSLTLLMFLTLLFTNKESKNINVSLFTFLAIAAQSLIFSEMLKERQILSQRQNLEIFGNLNTTTTASGGGRASHSPLTAVVVYQPSGTNRAQSGGIFMVDPILGAERAKDPPPSYFAASCPPPKYEDAIKLASTPVNVTQVSNSATTTTAEDNSNSNQPANQNEENNNNNTNNTNSNINDSNVEQQQQPETITTTTNNVDQTTSSAAAAASQQQQDQQQQQQQPQQ